MTPSLLLVDDDPDACDTTAELLVTAGYHVDTAPEGVTALKLAEARPYSLAIIDYQMPGMNGVELFRRLREKCPGLSGIFLTGHTTLNVVYPAIEAGAVRVLSKPVAYQELLAVIEEQLAAVH
jgi:DNA-binding response OmpR family regulator